MSDPLVLGSSTADTTGMLRHEQLGLSPSQLSDILCGMIRARELDDRLWQLGRQGKAHFVITAAGHEATQFGCALALRVGHDYLVPYYRDMALVLAMGQTPLELLLHAMGRAGDPASGARQMFGHFSSHRLRIVSGSSSVGSQIVHAAGLGLAFRVTGETDIAVLSTFGEGATSEGAWHEAMTFIGIHQLPVVLVCENNQYAISVPQQHEVPVPDVAVKAQGYGMPSQIVDGNDFFAVYEAVHAAMERARSGGGPTLLECKTYRLKPHSNADDDRKYRSSDELNAWRSRDPITLLTTYMLEHQLLTPDALADYRQAIRQEIDAATALADQTPQPPVESIFDHLYGS